MKVFDLHSMDGHAVVARRDGCMMKVHYVDSLIGSFIGCGKALCL